MESVDKKSEVEDTPHNLAKRQTRLQNIYVKPVINKIISYQILFLYVMCFFLLP